jgi:YbbR domain-containing protein
MNRIGLKLACLAASVVIWIQVASTTTTDATLRLPVELVNLPEGTTVAGSEIPARVSVKVRGSKLRLLGHTFLNRTAARLVIDLEGYQAGETIPLEITDADVRTDLTVESVQADARARLRLDHEVARRIPVGPVTVGQLRGDRQLLGPARAEPESVLVTGPQRVVDRLETLATEDVDLARLEQTSRLDRTVIAPSSFVRLAPEQVSVVVAVARVESRTLANIPVVPLMDPDQAEVAVSPPVADLLVRGPADSVRSLVPAQLGITVEVAGYGQGIHHLRAQVSIKPAWLTVVAVEPESFMVIVGEPEAAGPGADGP